jgi:hypothetical protein
MQKTQSLHHILNQLYKLNESISRLDNSQAFSALEMDLALEKIRGLYELLLQVKEGKPDSGIVEKKEEEFLGTIEVDDSMVETDKEELYTEEPIQKEVVPEPAPFKEEKIVEKPVEKVIPPITEPVEKLEVTDEAIPQEEAETELPVQEEIPAEKEIVQEEKPAPKVEEKMETEKASEPKTKKKPLPKENSGKVIGEQLGADKKSLYDLISGNKVDQDIVSQFKKKPVTDIHKAVSLNDKIWFTKELFNNDGALYRQYVDLLNASSDLEDALNIITQNFSWDSESRVVQKFLSIVSRRFI